MRLRSLRSFPPALTTTFAALAFPGASFAASTGGHGAGAPTAGQWILLVCTFANFILFAWLFRRFTKEPLKDFFKGRRKELVDLIAAAAKEKTEAESLRKEYEDKLARLDTARGDLVAEVRRVAESEGERAIAAAKEAAERIRRDAERAAASDVQRAIADLRAEAARLASDLAEQEVKSRLGAADKDRLVTDFLKEVAAK